MLDIPPVTGVCGGAEGDETTDAERKRQRRGVGEERIWMKDQSSMEE